MKNNRVLALLVVAVLLASFFTYVFAQSESNSFTLSPGIYPGAPTYTIYTDGTNYYAKNSLGLIEYSGINSADVINQALAGLTVGRTWQETVKIIGDYEIDDTLLVEAYTHLILDGKISLADGSDCNMLELADEEAWEVHIEGGVWYGNGDAQTSGSGFYIYFTKDNADNGYRENSLTINNLEITNTTNHCLYIQRASNGAASVKLDSLILDQPGDGDGVNFGLYMYTLNDASITNIHYVDRVRLGDVVFCNFNNVYANTVINMSGCYLNNFDNIILDTNLWQWYMYNCNSSNYNNLMIENIGNTVQEEALSLWYCFGNTFNNINVIPATLYQSPSTGYFTYGVFEVNGDNNIFSNINAEIDTTDALVLNSAGTSNSTNIRGGTITYP